MITDNLQQNDPNDNNKRFKQLDKPFAMITLSGFDCIKKIIKLFLSFLLIRVDHSLLTYYKRFLRCKTGLPGPKKI